MVVKPTRTIVSGSVLYFYFPNRVGEVQTGLRPDIIAAQDRTASPFREAPY